MNLRNILIVVLIAVIIFASAALFTIKLPMMRMNQSANDEELSLPTDEITPPENEQINEEVLVNRFLDERLTLENDVLTFTQDEEKFEFAKVEYEKEIEKYSKADDSDVAKAKEAFFFRKDKVTNKELNFKVILKVDDEAYRNEFSDYAKYKLFLESYDKDVKYQKYFKLNDKGEVASYVFVTDLKVNPDYKETAVKDINDEKENKEDKDATEVKDVKDVKEVKGTKEVTDEKKENESKDSKDTKEAAKEGKNEKEAESVDNKEKDVKSSDDKKTTDIDVKAVDAK